METIIFSRARKIFGGLCDRVASDKAPVEIVRRDKPSVIMMDKEEYEGLQETLHLLSSPRNVERIFQSIAELDEGKAIEFDPETDSLT